MVKTQVVRFTARELLTKASLWVSDIRSPGAVWRGENNTVFVGPGADENAIATIACSRLLELRGRDITEQALRREVQRYGFVIAPPKQPKTVKTRSVTPKTAKTRSVARRPTRRTA